MFCKDEFDVYFSNIARYIAEQQDQYLIDSNEQCKSQ